MTTGGKKPAKDRQAFILRTSPGVLKALEQWAADEFRSVNGQIEFLLHDALKRSGREPKEDAKKKG